MEHDRIGTNVKTNALEPLQAPVLRAGSGQSRVGIETGKSLPEQGFSN